MLTVYVSGPPSAQVTVTPTPEPPFDRHPCYQKEEPSDDEPCVYTLPQGPVTLVASPSDAFLRWSDPACGSNPVCETTAEACGSEPQLLCGSIVATFAPVQLILRVSGPGTATATPVSGLNGVTCGPPSPPDVEAACFILYPTITEVVIEAKPLVAGTPFAWGNASFCDPDPANAALCYAEVSFDPTNVGLGFHPAEPSENFIIAVTLRVVRGGAGNGRVTGVRRDGKDGQIIDCGSDCSQELEYAKTGGADRPPRRRLDVRGLDGGLLDGSHVHLQRGCRDEGAPGLRREAVPASTAAASTADAVSAATASATTGILRADPRNLRGEDARHAGGGRADESQRSGSSACTGQAGPSSPHYTRNRPASRPLVGARAFAGARPPGAGIVRDHAEELDRRD